MRVSFNCIFTTRVLMCVATAFLLSAGVAHAQLTGAPSRANASGKSAAAKEPLEIVLTRKKVVTTATGESLQDALIAKPGDILDERARYTNVSALPLRDLQATLPVPPNTELVMSSVSPINATASVDGKSFGAIPLKRKQKQANGVEVETLVPLSEYRYLRWAVAIVEPAKPLTFGARFKVSNSAPTSVATAKSAQ